jgi:hypothetical protein
MTLPHTDRFFPWFRGPRQAAPLLAGLALVALYGCSKQDPSKPPEGESGAAAGARRAQSQNNLKQMALSILSFNDTYRRLPPAAICDKITGKPLLSWRVILLPYLEQKPLFDEFKLDEPWDGPNNKKLLAKMPDVYAPLGVMPKEPHSTFYRVFVATVDPKLPPGSQHLTAWMTYPAPNTPFGAWGGPFPASISDGASNTIAIVEAAEAVPWTKPDELVYDARKPLPKLGGLFTDGFNVAWMDGSTRFIPHRVDEKTLRALITANGNEVVDPSKFD